MTTQDQIDELLDITRENNKLLKSLNRHSKLSFYGNLFYWAFIIIFVFGAYFFLKPFIDLILVNILHLQDLSQKMDAAASAGINFTNLNQIKEILQTLTK